MLDDETHGPDDGDQQDAVHEEDAGEDVPQDVEDLEQDPAYNPQDPDAKRLKGG